MARTITHNQCKAMKSRMLWSQPFQAPSQHQIILHWWWQSKLFHDSHWGAEKWLRLSKWMLRDYYWAMFMKYPTVCASGKFIFSIYHVLTKIKPQALFSYSWYNKLYVINQSQTMWNVTHTQQIFLIFQGQWNKQKSFWLEFWFELPVLILYSTLLM